MGNGTITRQFTVWCAACAKWEQTDAADTTRGAVEVFKGHGWGIRLGLGWVCRACGKRLDKDGRP